MQISPDLILGAAAGIASSALYAIAVVIYKSQHEEIRPLTITAFRIWIVLPFMTLLGLLQFIVAPLIISIETVALLAIVILLSVVMADTVYFMSQERIGVSFAFPIAMSFPILTYFLAIIFLSETLVLSRFIGIIVAVSGIILISGDQNGGEEKQKEKSHLDKYGIGLAVLAAIGYATATVILEASISDIDPISANPSRRASKIVGITGILDMGMAFFLSVVSVKYVGATIAAVVTSVAPLFAVPISVVFLKEHGTRKTSLGVLATVIGIILVIIGL
ncbi:MAG: EamA family transporter [Candidatus Thorarchaeota archaeon]|jgi:drug/metabolite transporter (DMT)-like permease